MLPDTDFPDIRYRCAIHSHNGSCMIIPREGDLIRLYIQLSDADILDPLTGRIDRNKMGPEQLLEVSLFVNRTWYGPYALNGAQ
jgi:phenol 2-monooxygenase